MISFIVGFIAGAITAAIVLAYSKTWMYGQDSHKPLNTELMRELNDNNGFVDLATAAIMLEVRPERLIQMHQAGEIFGYREGNSWKFKLSEIKRVRRESREWLDLPYQ